VEDAELQLQADILASERSVVSLRQMVENEKSATPFSAKDIVNAINKLEEAEAGVKILLSLQKQLFPKE